MVYLYRHEVVKEKEIRIFSRSRKDSGGENHHGTFYVGHYRSVVITRLSKVGREEPRRPTLPWSRLKVK